MEIRLIEYDSRDYEAMIALRMAVLLRPIGVPASYINRTKEKEDLLLGVFAEEKIVGCCILSRRDADTVQLRQMAVDIAYQGKGIGAALLAFAEAIAKEKGFHFLMMHARDPVIGFYKKYGYAVISEPFAEVGISHHKMQKDLHTSPVSQTL